MIKTEYQIGQRTAVDGKTWWVCYYKNIRGELSSVGKFKRKKDAVYFKENVLEKNQKIA